MNTESPNWQQFGLFAVWRLGKSCGACKNWIDVWGTPGYDPVSATSQAAGGALIICFTTGRGLAFGCAGAPTIKLAINNALFERMGDAMDVNCGDLTTGTARSAISQRTFGAVM